jgi:hypothetical protein
LNGLSYLGADVIDATEMVCCIVGIGQIGKSIKKLFTKKNFNVFKKGSFHLGDFKTSIKKSFTDTKVGIKKGFTDLKANVKGGYTYLKSNLKNGLLGKVDDVDEIAGVNKFDDVPVNEVDDMLSGVGTNPKVIENGPYIKNGKPNGRPTLSVDKKLEFEQNVFDNCVDPDNILRDPNTGQVIDWIPGQSRKGVVDFGHKQGKTYSEMFYKYKNSEISLDDLKEFQFSPDNYRLETPSANRSHIFE